ncbi:hypothetical protein TELCIR_17835 [Teladorsagia circumcincta]|uniref:Aurora kinase n=1 Tax=Teladorsagia circumcincta TaxID=45464 RepID=A0A2G9TRL8_TELCI|nr:hypothetical protein TELCIR_17835 [Teladorsagia circumcincta]
MIYGLTHDHTIPPIVKEGPRDLIRKLIVKEPCMRLSLAAVLAHLWVVSMSKVSVAHANHQTPINNASTTTQENQNSTE